MVGEGDRQFRFVTRGHNCRPSIGRFDDELANEGPRGLVETGMGLIK